MTIRWDRMTAPALKPPAGFARFWSFEERAPRTGVRGDLPAATAETGERILVAVTVKLVAAMRDVALWSPSHSAWRIGRAQ